MPRDIFGEDELAKTTQSATTAIVSESPTSCTAVTEEESAENETVRKLRDCLRKSKAAKKTLKDRVRKLKKVNERLSTVSMIKYVHIEYSS